MTGIGIAGCESGCGCMPDTAPTPPPTDPGGCDVLCDEIVDTATTYGLWFQENEVEDICYTCDACDTAPTQMILSFEAGTISLIGLTTIDPAFCTGDLIAILRWLESDGYTFDSCFAGYWYGEMITELRSCTRTADPDCADRPAAYFTFSTAQVLLYVWTDGHARMIVYTHTTGELTISWKTYEMNLTCCGLTPLVAGPYSWVCSEGIDFPHCGLDIAIATGPNPEYDDLEMIC